MKQKNYLFIADTIVVLATGVVAIFIFATIMVAITNIARIVYGPKGPVPAHIVKENCR